MKEKYFTVPKLAVDPVWDKQTRPLSKRNAEANELLGKMRCGPTSAKKHMLSVLLPELCVMQPRWRPSHLRVCSL